MRQTALTMVLGAIAAIVLTGCGGGGTGIPGTDNPPVEGRGAMGEASPMIGFIQFIGSGSCNNNGWYLTLKFDEDEQGNLAGTANGRYVSPSNPPPSGDEKYKGPLNSTITGKRTGDQITFTLNGDIKGTYTGDVEKASTLTKLSFNFDDQPGCTDSQGSVHGGKIFFVGDAITQ